jgi:hypothetical protein
MADILRSTIIPVRTEWPEVLVFLRQLEALAAAGTAFQLVETPGQVAWVVAEAPAAPVKAAASPRPRHAAVKA